MLKLNNLNSPKGAHRNIKRIGRGKGSGQGQQAGKGHKGQKARKSGGVRPGFEGGNKPLYMKLPKRGFKNAAFRVDYAEVNLSQIEKVFKGKEVTRASLIESGLLKGAKRNLPIKVLGNGEFKKSLTFIDIEKFSASAMEKITKAGGKIEGTPSK